VSRQLKGVRLASLHEQLFDVSILDHLALCIRGPLTLDNPLLPFRQHRRAELSDVEKVAAEMVVATVEEDITPESMNTGD